MRKTLIAGNWKMNLSLPKAEEVCRKILAEYRPNPEREVLICPALVLLSPIKKLLGSSPIYLGAQNAHFESEGAYTGEVSLEILASVGCSHLLIGHSERRAIFGERDSLVARKFRVTLFKRLVPVLCVGETLTERKAGRAEAIVARQIETAYQGIGVADASNSVIAYEPVWAIGTGETATPEQADQMHAWIRRVLARIYGENLADTVRILYGGSANEKNIDELIKKPNIDGALVGGASLKPEAFLRMINYLA